MNKLKVVSLFSGIGAYEKAIKNLGIEYDLANKRIEKHLNELQLHN